MTRVLLILLTLIGASLVWGQSAEEAVNLLEDQNGFGIRAAALGNAYTGVADDYSAIYWNPAGLAQIKKNELYGSLYNLNLGNKATYLGTETSQNRSYTKFQSIGFAYPFPVSRGSLVVALGYQRVKDLDSYSAINGEMTAGTNSYLAFDMGYKDVLPFDSLLAQKQLVANDGHLNQWSFGAAMEFSPQFSAGMTLSILSGRSEYAFDYSQDDIYSINNYNIFDDQGNLVESFYYNYYDLHQKITSDYFGWEAKLGGMFRLTENLRIGSTITLPSTITVEENWSETDELSYDIVAPNGDSKTYTDYPYDTDNLNDDGFYDYKIKVPFQFGLGASYSSDLFLLSGSIEYKDWSQTKYEMPDDRDALDYEDLLAQNQVFRDDFQAVLSYALGGEVNLVNNMISLRGGYRYVPSPLKNVDTKYDKQYFSAGAGFKLDSGTVLEAGYTLGLWEKAKNYNFDWDYNGVADYSLPTSEKLTSSRFVLGLRWQF
jgi:long-subunit fatty acid transport protein